MRSFTIVGFTTTVLILLSFFSRSFGSAQAFALDDIKPKCALANDCELFKKDTLFAFKQGAEPQPKHKHHHRYSKERRRTSLNSDKFRRQIRGNVNTLVNVGSNQILYGSKRPADVMQNLKSMCSASTGTCSPEPLTIQSTYIDTANPYGIANKSMTLWAYGQFEPYPPIVDSFIEAITTTMRMGTVHKTADWGHDGNHTTGSWDKGVLDEFQQSSIVSVVHFSSPLGNASALNMLGYMQARIEHGQVQPGWCASVQGMGPQIVSLSCLSFRPSQVVPSRRRTSKTWADK